MARKCDICGKSVMSGNNVSHSHKKTRRVFKPNLQSVTLRKEGIAQRLKVCTKCIKTLEVS